MLLAILVGCVFAESTFGQSSNRLPRQAQAAPMPEPPIALQPVIPQESLDDAWSVALGADQRVQASRWNLSSSMSNLSAAQAEMYPSLQLGGTVYSLSERPEIAIQSGPFTVRSPILDQNAVGLQALVSQPLYTSGRITSGINAANEVVCANQFEVQRTKLDVKMNVAEIYVITLRSSRLIEVADSRAVSLDAHTTDVSSFFDKGLVSRNDLLAAQVA
jgi:outer membrane protein